MMLVLKELLVLRRRRGDSVRLVQIRLEEDYVNLV
jgi:hypothetical protein